MSFLSHGDQITVAYVYSNDKTECVLFLSVNKQSMNGNGETVMEVASGCSVQTVLYINHRGLERKVLRPKVARKAKTSI